MNFLNFLIKPRFVRKGKCKKCGYCCRNITFRLKDKLITEFEEFNDLKKSQPRYNHFFASGQDEIGTLLFTCKSLGEDGKCRSYAFRSLFCRVYPTYRHTNGETLEGCGFYFEKKF